MALAYWVRWYHWFQADYGKYHLQDGERSLCGRKPPRFGTIEQRAPKPLRELCCKQCIAALEARLPADG